MLFHHSYGQSQISIYDKISVLSNCIYSNNGLLTGDGKLYALLIGINEPNWDFKKLNGPKKEINKLAKFLRSQDYCVVSLINENATRDSIIAWLSFLKCEATPKDRILFYFTGHASPLDSIRHILKSEIRRKMEKEPGDEFYLFPYQKNKRGINELLSLKEIVEILNEYYNRLPARQRIFIIDACFGGYFVNMSPLVSYMYDNQLPPNGFYALTSLKAEIFDGDYGPIILKGLKGEADNSVEKGVQQFVDIWELTQYLDKEIQKKYGENIGENFTSRYIFTGSGNVFLTKIK